MSDLSQLAETLLDPDTSEQQVSDRALVQVLERAAVSDPASTLHAFDPDDRSPCRPPEALAKIFRTPAHLVPLDELCSDGGRDELEAAWTRALRFGGSRVAIEDVDQPGSTRWWSVLNLTSLFGCVIVAIASEVIPQEVDNLVPRQCTMRTDEASMITNVDEACTLMLGYSREELLGKTSLQFVHPDDHESAIVGWIKMLDAPGTSLRMKLRYVRASGEAFWTEVTYHNRLQDLGWIDREIVDVHEQVGAQIEASHKDRVIRGLADVLPSGVAQFDLGMAVIFSNDRWREITGTDESTEAQDLSTYRNLFVEPSFPELYRNVRRGLAATGSYDGEITITPGGGAALRRCRLAFRSLIDGSETPTGYVACIDDITDGWRLQQRLVDQATRDQLTGLINRTAALEHLDETLDKAQQTGTSTAVIFADLNEFKRVNDVLGHAAGDQLLCEVAAKILRVVRGSDVVARQGGDEFLIICDDVNGYTEAIEVARRVINAISGSYRVGEDLIDTSASCGISIDLNGDHTGERMIAEADLAMYERKRNRSQEPGLFQQAMFEEQRQELNRDSALARAIEDQSLVLHYQPIVDLQSEQTVGYEALLRWNFEDQLVMPDQFIGLAERRGLIIPIGAWVVDEVCRQASMTDDSSTTWSLNVSPLQLRDAAFDSVVAQAIDRHGIKPHQLALELTEGVIVTNDHSTQALLQRLREIGVKLIIDDFGTGYASLDYLRNFPLHGLKIDRSFTADLANERTHTIVSTVVALAGALDVSLVVEGIETPEQAVQVAATGAVHAQGYLFGRPQPLSQ